MAMIAELEIPVEEFVLWDTLTTIDDVAFEVDRSSI